jgi:hypothetical protein
MTLIDGQDSNPWEQFETLGEIFGFVHKQHGLDGVRRTLELDTEGVFTREALHDAARELKAAGLTKAAAVVAEFAANSPSMLVAISNSVAMHRKAQQTPRAMWLQFRAL